MASQITFTAAVNFDKVANMRYVIFSCLLQPICFQTKTAGIDFMPLWVYCFDYKIKCVKWSEFLCLSASPTESEAFAAYIFARFCYRDLPDNK